MGLNEETKWFVQAVKMNCLGIIGQYNKQGMSLEQFIYCLELQQFFAFSMRDILLGGKTTWVVPAQQWYSKREVPDGFDHTVIKAGNNEITVYFEYDPRTNKMKLSDKADVFTDAGLVRGYKW